MPAQIPGYFYDELKGRYFKIEKTQTARPAAPYSASAVQRREADRAARAAASRHDQRLRRHIRRAPLRHDVFAGAVLARELCGRGVGGAALGAAAWAGGLRAKGEVPFAPSFARTRYANLPCFHVAGCEGLVYATLDEETLTGSYLPTDKDERIAFHRHNPGARASTSLSFHNEMVRCPQMSSIKYHRTTHQILLTSREPDRACSLYCFTPPLHPNPEKHWLLGEANHYQHLSLPHRLRDGWVVHQCAPAPSSSELVCVLGTNAGVVRVSEDGRLARVRPTQRATRAAPQEIFDLDFQQDHTDVILAGGRQPFLWTIDMRAPNPSWHSLAQASSVAHVRSVNARHVLVAGPRSTMALYDVRFSSPDARPVVRFPGYTNEAHIFTGWDVSTELDVVAAAQDDGTVRLFSLQTGQTLLGGAVDAIKLDRPVRALSFARLGEEDLPSLFVGEGPSLRKYSLSARDDLDA